MPLYEYVCQDCGTRFEAFRSMKDADEAIRCKNCLSLHTRRALSRVAARSADGSFSTGSGCSGCSGGSCSSYHH